MPDLTRCEGQVIERQEIRGVEGVIASNIPQTYDTLV